MRTELQNLAGIIDSLNLFLSDSINSLQVTESYLKVGTFSKSSASLPPGKPSCQKHKQVSSEVWSCVYMFSVRLRKRETEFDRQPALSDRDPAFV